MDRSVSDLMTARGGRILGLSGDTSWSRGSRTLRWYEVTKTHDLTSTRDEGSRTQRSHGEKGVSTQSRRGMGVPIRYQYRVGRLGLEDPTKSLVVWDRITLLMLVITESFTWAWSSGSVMSSKYSRTRVLWSKYRRDPSKRDLGSR